MRKVYIPIYLIEWSDVRPYVLMAAHGLRVGAQYTWIGLCILAQWGLIAAQWGWKGLKELARLTLIGMGFLWVGLQWLGRYFMDIVINLFTVSNPRHNEDDYEDDEDEDDEDATEEPQIRRASGFFEED